MDEMDFKTSAATSIGIELELQLVRPHDLDLAHDAADLLRGLERRKIAGAVKPEITQSMIELNSAVHPAFDSLAAELEATRHAVSEEAGLLNLRVSGGGSHPFHDWADRRIYPTERFHAVLERYGYLAKQFTVFGQHIHVGCPSGDDAVSLVHLMTRYVPHFIALSAASPFYQGEDTAFQSSRLTAVSAFPLAGSMPFVADWAEFAAYFAQMKGFGIVASMKDFYWDIRPKPEYGTIEIRVCDTPLTVRRAALLAAYAQALAGWCLTARPYQPSPAVYRVNSFNRFEACRFGLAGEIVDPYAGVRRRIGEDVLETLALIDGPHVPAGSRAALAELRASVDAGHSDADWLRLQRKAGGSLADVVRSACELWAAPGS